MCGRLATRYVDAMTLRGILLIVVAAVLAADAAAAGPQAWVQMVGGGAQARLVTDAETCPTITIDGRSAAMSERAGTNADFANRVCAADIPVGVRSAKIGAIRLPVPRRRPARLVILGDSGCRLKGLVAQHCNDPSGWPFARVAALAAAQKPDLVIHVGDYYYRERACPEGEAACAGSPFGDHWPTWKAEVFDPAAPLLAAAPWVFVRGNHEDCQRGAKGWFRQFDAAPFPKACPAQSDTFSVDLGGLRLWVVDSADSEDMTAPPDKTAAFVRRLGAVRGGENAWIVTHRPVWDSLRLGGFLSDSVVNATERAALKGRDLPGVAMILSGHVHNFTALSFGPARPAQLIVGTGGDELSQNDTPPPVVGQVDIDSLPADVFTMGRFGYLLLERKGDDWAGAFHDLNDKVAAVCRLHARVLTCGAPKG